MKPLLALLALMLCCTFARADLAEVKRVMDEPVVLSSAFKRRNAQSDKHLKDVEQMNVLISRPKAVWDFKASPREILAVLGQSQGRTSTDLWLLHQLAQLNSAELKARLLPALKSASLTAAASDLEEALKSVETSKTLDRAAQDRFARLAKVAP